MTTTDYRLGKRHGVRWMSTWPHVSLGVSAHINRRFGHVSLHLPIGVVIIGYIGEPVGA